MINRAAILDRIVQPGAGGWSAELARHLLSMEFTSEEQALYDSLAAKSDAGELTSDEAAILDEFISLNALLMILQSKARISLKQQSTAA